ncbi:MAG: cytochrome c3 family protein [Pseudomonadota bacterium]
MKNRIWSGGIWAKWVCATVLALGVWGDALAVLTDSQVGTAGKLLPGYASSVSATATSSVVGTFTVPGGVVSPFAAISSVNITNSRHNLGTKNTIGTNHTPDVLSADRTTVIGTNQICVFCHTPHGFNTVQSAPLWNRAVKSSATYTVYNATGATNVSSTLDAATPSIGSVSLACLSCHDGTQAMDVMINGPGSGLMAQAGNSGASNGYTWSQFGIQSQTATVGDGSFSPTNNIITPANASARGIWIGTDLSNDHPISVQYCGGGIMPNQMLTAGTAHYADGSCNDRLFNLPTVGFLNNAERFWIDTNVIPDTEAIAASAASIGGAPANPITRDPNTVELFVTANSNALATGNNGDTSGRGFIPSTSAAGVSTIDGFGVRTKQDLMLFSNPGVTGPSVECATCHDPHTPNNGTFLRVSNNGSGLCLSCHVK